MSEYSPIDNLPEGWTRKIRCPICHSTIVKIQRFENKPDLIHCPNCGISFQIERQGQHILFLETPINFNDNMKNRWLSRDEIEEALKKTGARVHDVTVEKRASKPVIIKSNPVRAEAVRRARSLVQLKNPPDAVRSALKGTLRLSEMDIEEIIKDAFNVYEEHQKQRNLQIIKYSIIIVVLMILFFIILSFLI